MSNDAGVTLQVSVAPSDARYAGETIAHQIRQLGGQVQEVLFTIDTHRGGRGHVRNPEAEKALDKVLEPLCAQHPNARFIYIDYSPEMMAEVAAVYFDGRELPRKDFKGTPIYPYFYALHASRNDHVFHLDADMMLGGGSPTWSREAVQVLRDRPDVLACNPLAGPPAADGLLRSQRSDPEHGLGRAFRFDTLSTRIFIADRRTLAKHFSRERIRMRRPFRSVAKAIVKGHTTHECIEETVSRMMTERTLRRVDFLGREPGMWSLHPPVRSERYYRLLPELLRCVEQGEVPEVQRGEFDLQEAMLDWMEARATVGV
jgi:hypothetical protein